MTKKRGFRGNAASRLNSISKGVMIASLAVGPTAAFAQDTSIDLSKWSPEYVRSMAGTSPSSTPPVIVPR